MNIIAEQLNSKQNTQLMLSQFLHDTREYFKKAPLLTEDKTYARILKIAENTQKCLNDLFSVNNISLKLIGLLKMRVDDKFEDQSLQSGNQEKKSSDSDTLEEQAATLQKIKMNFSHDSSNEGVVTLNRDINQDFMRKLVLDAIEQLSEDLNDHEEAVYKQLQLSLEQGSSILFFDSKVSNKALITRAASKLNINVKNVKTSGADLKNNEINLVDISSEIRKINRVIISADAVLRNGSVICESGSLMLVLAAKKYHIPVFVLSRGFGLTQKCLIDQYILLSENPMTFYPKNQENSLKVYIGKRFDLIQSNLVSLIINEIGSVGLPNLELHFASYYDNS